MSDADAFGYGARLTIKTFAYVVVITLALSCALLFLPDRVRHSTPLMIVPAVAMFAIWGAGPLVIAMVPALLTAQRHAPTAAVLLGVVAVSVVAAGVELALVAIVPQFIAALSGR